MLISLVRSVMRNSAGTGEGSHGRAVRGENVDTKVWVRDEKEVTKVRGARSSRGKKEKGQKKMVD